jgi:hypothetical protein
LAAGPAEGLRGVQTPACAACHRPGSDYAEPSRTVKPCQACFGGRPSLRHTRPPVQACCAQRGIAYCETGRLASYAQVLGTCSRLAGWRPRPAADKPPQDRMRPRPGHPGDSWRPAAQAGAYWYQ